MSIPSNGITAEVIRESMAPYLLSLDLLHATFAAIPAPPPDATPAWRRARVTRLTAEIVAPMPANADQARISAQVLIFRELADTSAKAAQAPGQTADQMCRLARTANGLMRTAIELRRSLARLQQKPAPFFGTIDDQEVDIAAVDARWGNHAAQPPGQPPAQPIEPPSASPPKQPPRDTTPPPAQPDPAPATPTPPNPETHTAPSPHTQPAQPPHPDHVDGTPEWTRIKLDEGPGWSREVLRHRSSNTGGNGTTPGSTT
jgi:hypothetical protein